jgi:type IV pilus biogenesis protein CpaD/CtpE
MLEAVPGRTRAVGNVTASRLMGGLALAAFVAAALGGCSETMSLAQLPDVTKLPQKLLNKDEQQGKVNEMIAKGQTHQSEAAKEIEKAR